MKLVWSPQALVDLKEVHGYIAQESPASATKIVERIAAQAALQLADNPLIGRPGRVEGTRELVIARTPFVVPYRVQAEHIEILRVYHGARLWPNEL